MHYTPRLLPALAIGGMLFASGCSFVSDSLWPTLGGDDPPPPQQRVQIPASNAETNPQPTLGGAIPPASGFAAAPAAGGLQPIQPAPALPGQVPALSTAPAAGGFVGGQSGTFVGQKVGQLRGELQRLQGRLSQQGGQLQQLRGATTQNAQRYHGTVAAMTARLQLGTTPGNPVLVSQWNAAQAELDRVSADIAAMNALSSDIASNSSLAAYIMESARAAYRLSGAVDEDHRQLALLEDETNRTVVLIDRLLTEVAEDVERQTRYVGSERANLTGLSQAIGNGELAGPGLLNRTFGSGAPARGNRLAALRPAAPATPSGQPLVVIRFDRPDVPYQQALYNAISQALERRPDVSFDVVAVAPAQGNQAQVALAQSKSQKYANDVVRTLTEIGLPASRITLSATTARDAATNEVRIFVR